METAQPLFQIGIVKLTDIFDAHFDTFLAAEHAAHEIEAPSATLPRFASALENVSRSSGSIRGCAIYYILYALNTVI